MIEFSPLTKTDLSLIHKWFNEPHVKEFYSLRDWTLADVKNKYQDYFAHKTDVQPYIAYNDGTPFGYIQKYPVKNHPWKGQEIAEEIIDSATGIDYFIGEKDFLNMGLGRKMIQEFMKKHIFPKYKYCIADPSLENEKSISVVTKNGLLSFCKILRRMIR